MAGRPLAKPEATAPVVASEEQAEIETAKDAEPEATAPVTEATKAEKPEHRFEEFEATKPDGTVVHIRRNIDTGEQDVTEK